MKTLQLTFLAILAVCFASCSDNKAAEEVSSKMIEEFQKIPDIIKNVNDLDSAKEASSKLAQIGSDLNVVFKKNKDAKITKSKEKEMQKNIETQLKGVSEAIEAKIQSLTATDPAAAQELSAGFMKLITNMSEGIE